MNSWMRCCFGRPDVYGVMGGMDKIWASNFASAVRVNKGENEHMHCVFASEILILIWVASGSSALPFRFS